MSDVRPTQSNPDDAWIDEQLLPADDDAWRECYAVSPVVLTPVAPLPPDEDAAVDSLRDVILKRAEMGRTGPVAFRRAIDAEPMSLGHRPDPERDWDDPTWWV